MKLLVIAASFFLVALCVNAAPTIEEIDDDVARLRVKNTLETVEAILVENEDPDDDDMKDKYVKSLIKTVDRECIFTQYKKYHYTHDLLDDSVLKNKLEDFADTYDIGLIRFGIVSASCSNKIDPILRFIFEILFSVGELADAFRYDPPFNLGDIKLFFQSCIVDTCFSFCSAFDDVNCYTNYAIAHGLVDDKEYNFLNKTLVNQTVEECHKEVDATMMEIKMMMSMFEEGPLDKHAVECVDNQLYEMIKKLVFKYSLLFSAEVTPMQKAQEKLNFVKDIKTTIEKIAFCDAISQYMGIAETPQV